MSLENTGLVKVDPAKAGELATAAKERIAKARVAAVHKEAERRVELHRQSWIRRLFRWPVKTVDDVLEEWAESDKTCSVFHCSPLVTSKTYWLTTERVCDEVLRMAAMSQDEYGDCIYLSPAQVEAIHEFGWGVDHV